MTPDTTDPSLIRNSWDDPEFTDVPARAQEAQGNRRGAKGYLCCRHCSEDTVHDVQADGHDGPCQSCDDPSILLWERAKAAESERDELRATVARVEAEKAAILGQVTHAATLLRLSGNALAASTMEAQVLRWPSFVDAVLAGGVAADVTVYEHTREDGTRYLVVDIDNEIDDDQPVAVYINDGPVFGPPTPFPADLDVRDALQKVYAHALNGGMALDDENEGDLRKHVLALAEHADALRAWVKGA